MDEKRTRQFRELGLTISYYRKLNLQKVWASAEHISAISKHQE